MIKVVQSNNKSNFDSDQSWVSVNLMGFDESVRAEGWKKDKVGPLR